MASAERPDSPQRAASDVDPIVPTSVTTVLVNIDVPDLATAERFYTAAFGPKACINAAETRARAGTLPHARPREGTPTGRP